MYSWIDECGGKDLRHLLRVNIARITDEFFVPPRISDPEQWEKFPSKREKFEVEATDGILLRGSVVPAEGCPLGTIVILHGHMSCADRMAWRAQQASLAGFNAVVYDARAHGRSGGEICTFGLREAEDARVIAWCIQKFFPDCGPISLWGMSMGSAVGAQALAGNTPFAGGALFAPFSDLDAMISATLTQQGIPPSSLIASNSREKIRELIGADPADVSPLRAAANIHVPVLVVHGSKDARIPIAQGRAVFEAIPHLQKDFLELPEAGHSDLTDLEKPWGKSTLTRVFDSLRRSG